MQNVDKDLHSRTIAALGEDVVRYVPHHPWVLHNFIPQQLPSLEETYFPKFCTRFQFSQNCTCLICVDLQCLHDDALAPGMESAFNLASTPEKTRKSRHLFNSLACSTHTIHIHIDISCIRCARLSKRSSGRGVSQSLEDVWPVSIMLIHTHVYSSMQTHVSTVLKIGRSAIMNACICIPIHALTSEMSLYVWFFRTHRSSMLVCILHGCMHFACIHDCEHVYACIHIHIHVWLYT